MGKDQQKFVAAVKLLHCARRWPWREVAKVWHAAVQRKRRVAKERRCNYF